MGSEHNSKTVLFLNSVLRNSEILLVQALKYLRLGKWMYMRVHFAGDKVLGWRTPNFPSKLSSEQDNLICHERFFQKRPDFVGIGPDPKFAPFLRTFLPRRNLDINGGSRYIYIYYIGIYRE